MEFHHRLLDCNTCITERRLGPHRPGELPDNHPRAHLTEPLDVAGDLTCPDGEPEAVGRGDADLPVGAAGTDEGPGLGAPEEEDTEKSSQLSSMSARLSRTQGRRRIQISFEVAP